MDTVFFDLQTFFKVLRSVTVTMSERPPSAPAEIVKDNGYCQFNKSCKRLATVKCTKGTMKDKNYCSTHKNKLPDDCVFQDIDHDVTPPPPEANFTAPPQEADVTQDPGVTPPPQEAKVTATAPPEEPKAKITATAPPQKAKAKVTATAPPQKAKVTPKGDKKKRVREGEENVGDNIRTKKMSVYQAERDETPMFDAPDLAPSCSSSAPKKDRGDTFDRLHRGERSSLDPGAPKLNTASSSKAPNAAQDPKVSILDAIFELRNMSIANDANRETALHVQCIARQLKRPIGERWKDITDALNEKKMGIDVILKK